MFHAVALIIDNILKTNFIWDLYIKFSFKYIFFFRSNLRWQEGQESEFNMENGTIDFNSQVGHANHV